MRILDINEHLTCFNYEESEKPIIELTRIRKGQKAEFTITSNEIVFVMEGKVKYTLHNYPDCVDYDIQRRQMIFLPAGSTCGYETLTDIMLIVFRMYQPMVLCSGFSIEKLYKHGKDKRTEECRPTNHQFGKLEINARLWYFLDGIVDCIDDGLKCRGWFELKIKEFFNLITVYYPKEEVYDFLYMILSGDTVFSEYIRQHWMRFHSVQEMAESMNMTVKQFSNRFVAIFEKTPYRWMQESKARIVQQEIVSSDKPFKQIAIEYGFSTESMFTHFCKKEIGNTPTQIRIKKNNLAE